MTEKVEGQFTLSNCRHLSSELSLSEIPVRYLNLPKETLLSITKHHAGNTGDSTRTGLVPGSRLPHESCCWATPLGILVLFVNLILI